MKRPTVASSPDRSARSIVMEQGVWRDNRVYGRRAGRLHLFYETTHSPSLIEFVGVNEARLMTDF